MSNNPVNKLLCVVMVGILILSCGKDDKNPVDPGTVDPGINKYGSIEVTVVDQHDLPYEGVSVQVESESNSTLDDLITNATGIARFDSLPPGKYDISSATGRKSGETPLIDFRKHNVIVSAGGVMPVKFNYPAGPADSECGALFFVVDDVYGNPFEGVEIHIRLLPGETEVATTTTADGIARFDSLTPGRYYITFSAGRMDGDTPIMDGVTNATVSAGETVPVTYTYSFDPGSTGDYGTLLVRTVDEHENPIENIKICASLRLRKTEIKITTNAEGIARFDSLMPGEYSFYVQSVNSDKELPYINHSVFGVPVSAGKTTTQSFYYPIGPVDVDVQVQINSKVNTEHGNIDLYFPCWDCSLSLDEEGKGVLENIVLTKNDSFVSVTRNGMVISAHMSIMSSPGGWPYINIQCYSQPVLEIVMPQSNAMLYNGSVRLVCDGYDFEDGSLPDDAFSWSSDIDGELGTGRDIIPSLSIGRHTITLTGEDSIGFTSSTSVEINVSHFSSQTYFPLPEDGIWKYRYYTPELVVINNKGNAEQWILEDMIVLVKDLTARICEMEWTVESDDTEMICRYTLTDHLTTDGNRFLVTGTDELLAVYDGDDMIEELAVETVYSPSYPLLTDYLDPVAGKEKTALTAESSFEYTITGIGTHSWSETETFTVSYEAGLPEDVMTDTGTYAAIPVQSTYDGVKRTWWLARGIGIVQMEYDLFGETVTASLYDTNMDNFAKGAGKRAALFRSTAPVRIQVDSSTGEQKKMREIMRIMRDLCPR